MERLVGDDPPFHAPVFVVTHHARDPQPMDGGTKHVVGDEALVRYTISAYRHAGVDVPVVFPLTWGAAGQDALEPTLRAAISRSATAPGDGMLVR